MYVVHNQVEKNGVTRAMVQGPGSRISSRTFSRFWVNYSSAGVITVGGWIARRGSLEGCRVQHKYHTTVSLAAQNIALCDLLVDSYLNTKAFPDSNVLVKPNNT
eukprot:1161803-Pelagomonas_calceolata.AAC.22